MARDIKTVLNANHTSEINCAAKKNNQIVLNTKDSVCLTARPLTLFVDIQYSYGFYRRLCVLKKEMVDR